MQHAGHGSGVGAVGRHNGAVGQLDVSQKAFVALVQDPVDQGLELHQGCAHRGKAGHGACRGAPMLPAHRHHNATVTWSLAMARSLKGIALVVTLGTLLSKVGGLVRQLVIAAAFGVGAAYDAYNYAYVLPGFLLILLGGINGPFHSAMV